MLAHRRVFIDFDGVMANSDVWINGVHLGHRPYGYVSFRYELTGLTSSPANQRPRRARRRLRSSPPRRWYAGAGIYRHVRLVVTRRRPHRPLGRHSSPRRRSAPTAATVHVADHRPQSGRSAAQADAAVTSPCSTAGGKTVAAPQPQRRRQSPPARPPQISSRTLTVSCARTLEPGPPRSLPARHHVFATASALDDETTPFGIREFHFEASHRLLAQRQRTSRSTGVCLHHDAGALGAAVPLAAWERRLAELRRLGVNAIRTAHNPPAPEFLDLVRPHGLLVMDEMFDCWTVAKNPYDYHLYFNEWSSQRHARHRARDRNHPSIILCSAGNEIHDTPKAEIANPDPEVAWSTPSTRRPHAPRDPGALPPQRQPRLRQRPGRPARRGRPELPREGNPQGRTSAQSPPARSSAPKTPTTAARGWPCAITRRTPASSSGPASTTWANRGAGRQSARHPGCSIAPDTLKPMGTERQSWWSESRSSTWFAAFSSAGARPHRSRL